MASKSRWCSEARLIGQRQKVAMLAGKLAVIKLHPSREIMKGRGKSWSAQTLLGSGMTPVGRDQITKEGEFTKAKFTSFFFFSVSNEFA